MVSYKPLKAHMGANDITNHALSETTGITERTLSNIFNGKVSANVKTIEKISFALKLPIEKIIEIKEK